MRANVTEIELDGFNFVLELDTGGDPDYPYTLWISKDGEGIANKAFTKNYSKTHLRNFIKKFVSNEAYRRQYTG